MNASSLARASALAVLWLTAGVTHAIEAPKPQAAPEQSREAPPPEVTITPTDEREFYQKVQRVTAYRGLRGLEDSAPCDYGSRQRRRRQGGRGPQRHRGSGRQRGEHCARERAALVRAAVAQQRSGIRKPRSQNWYRACPIREPRASQA
jgi:hypothetical protein